MNLSPAYYQWEEETLNNNKGIQLGKQEAVVKLVKAGMNLEQIAQILDLDPSLIQQALESGS